jgi:predicted nucleic acid-binding protein
MIGADTTFLVQLELIELPAHKAAHELLRSEILQPQVPLALAPQVLAEFIHVVTDPRRFQKPLTAAEALAKAHFWWHAAEVQPVFPTSDSTTLFLDWMQRHQLGRKRILDTQLAASLWTAGVRTVLTSNPADFQIFGFHALVPS